MNSYNIIDLFVKKENIFKIVLGDLFDGYVYDQDQIDVINKLKAKGMVNVDLMRGMLRQLNNSIDSLPPKLNGIYYENNNLNTNMIQTEQNLPSSLGNEEKQKKGFFGTLFG